MRLVYECEPQSTALRNGNDHNRCRADAKVAAAATEAAATTITTTSQMCVNERS